MRKNKAKALLIGILLFTLASCAHAPDSFRDENMDFSAVKTVAVMPFANLSPDSLASERVRDTFSTMLLSTGAFYVLPPGEVARGISRVGISNPASPTAEEVVKLGSALGVGGVITGVVREYGEVRSASTTANSISLSVAMLEAQTGRVVWKASSTEGGITIWDRMFGGGGKPMNDVTVKAVNDLLDKLFK